MLLEAMKERDTKSSAIGVVILLGLALLLAIAVRLIPGVGKEAPSAPQRALQSATVNGHAQASH